MGAWALASACASGGDPTAPGDDDNVGASSAAGHGGGGHGATSTAGGHATTTTSAGGTGGSAPCSEQPCKLTLPQCGCATDEQCTLVEGSRTCVANGSVGAGLECTGNDCVAGYLCVQMGGPPGTCHKFCEVDNDCSPPAGLCAIPLTGSGGADPVTVCSESCNPITSSGCPVAGMKCDLAQATAPPQSWFTLCTLVGTAGQGQSCVVSGDCATGLGCFNTAQPPSQDLRCLAWCKPTAPSCPTNTSCNSLNPQLLIGSDEYGACV
jgi:hypothetical protein